MTSKRQGKGRGKQQPKTPTTTSEQPDTRNVEPASGEPDEPIGGIDAADVLGEETSGDRLETRDRNPDDERMGRDALDDNVQLAEAPDDLAIDAVDEIAAAVPPDEYETTEEGDRRAPNDDAEMGLGGEPRSIDELADRAIGDAIPRPRGTTREGEPHGPDLGLR
jgi:hypothetical protein